MTVPVLGDGVSHFTPGLSVRTSGETRFQHFGLKNIDAQSSGSQSISASRTYDAYGNTVGSSGSWSGPFGYGGAFGYQSEADSGLQLLGHRYYDPSAGRFLSRDKARDGGNWYAYFGNAPLTRADPTGQTPLQVAGFIAAGLVFAWDAYDFYQNCQTFRGDPTLLNFAFIVMGVVDISPGNSASKVAKHADEIIAAADDVLEGVYVGTAKNGLPYVGQTGNHFDRIRPGHHKLDVSQPVDFIPMPGSTRREREIREALILKDLGGPGEGVTANERWPINELLRKELGL